MIVGVDEVGRGAWAGPLVVGAVVLGGVDIPGLTDSKKLSSKKRNKLAKIIKSQAAAIGLGWVSAQNIDKFGLGKSLSLATKLALNEIKIDYDQIIIDGSVKFVDDPRVSVMKQADLLIPSVSAASIIAKVARDYYMTTACHQDFPGYGFDRHVGYGTAAHQAALTRHGVTTLHRLSYAPIKKIAGIKISSKLPKAIPTEGARAEDMAAEFLIKRGFEIVDQNWRTKWCEIDIIAKKNNVIYFVEVKHRQQSKHGDGFEAITKKKLAQMKFAARLWQKTLHYSGDARLGVIASAGNPPRVISWLSNVGY